MTRDRPILRANQTPRVEIEPSGFAWVGLNDLVVHPDHRGRGHGRTLVNARLSWAYGLVLDRPILQVMRDNETAQRLQARLGFTEA